jgi:alkylated DNA repair protein (DNA oxidative demethylase)
VANPGWFKLCRPTIRNESAFCPAFEAYIGAAGTCIKSFRVFWTPAPSRSLFEPCASASPMRRFIGLSCHATGKPLSVRMTNLGELGWISDRQGISLSGSSSGNRQTLAANSPRSCWKSGQGGDYPHPPEACLVNFYDSSARMGLHQDRDEEDFDAPVVSVSLGDTAVFRVGGPAQVPHAIAQARIGRCGGDGRSCEVVHFHGIDRILARHVNLLKTADGST